MSQLTLHTQESAPTDSRPLLASVEKAYGFVPNMTAILAESPATLKAYMTVSKIFDESSLTAAERQIAILTINEYHACHYCVAAHSMAAERVGVEAAVIEAIREGTEIPDARLQALRVFTRQILDHRGWVDHSEIEAFLAAGFTMQQVLEVILAVALKTISNYTNHIADTPLDEAFKSHAWTPRLKPIKESSQ